MKVFVLGRSASGKTPMAQRLAAALGLAHVPASAWVRARFPGADRRGDGTPATRQAFVEAITRFSTVELARDPFVCLDHLAAHHDLTACVIEGVRNPFDFVHLFDPRTDAVVTLAHGNTALTATGFEAGLDVIDAYLAWLDGCGLAGAGPRLRYTFGAFRRGDAGAEPGDTLDDALDDAIATLAPVVAAAAATAAAPTPTPARVHAPIPPLRCHVRTEYLYGMDPARVGTYTPCTAFVVSSYPGEAPTFQLLLGDGAVFSYVPPSALVDPARLGADADLELADLVYFDCPDEQLVVHRHAALDGEVLAYFKRPDRWVAGRYLFTIEWWTGNHLAHAVALASGQYAVLPHHKLKFGSGHAAGFEPYKKIRKVWKVGRGPDDAA
ncbi:MAG: hypothetical protein H6708_04760 [Kofleriaceae bacterium]|nr:hypothetical protein [Myxococcales bacterium]MCB9559698.1 hypothetical protein [Kofleriaceae bacterium]